MRRSITLVLLIAMLPAGCRRLSKAPKVGDVVQRPQNPPVAYVADNDAQMQEATREAQKTLGVFVQVLEDPKASQSGMAVKAAVREEGSPAEAVWLTAVRFDGKSFHGTVGNEPIHLKNTHLGSKLSVEADKVADWMVIDNGKLRGGFTMRVVRAALQGDARKKFDQSAPFSFD